MDIRRDLCELPDLQRLVLELVGQIPVGRTATYGDLAEALGDRVASRWIGHFLLHHRHLDACRCHRVVRANGDLGLFVTGDAEEKANRLRADGVRVIRGCVDLSTTRFTGLRCSAPLRRLRAAQAQLSADLLLVDRLPQRRIAGVDVSYRGDVGVAAYIETDENTDEPCWSAIVQRIVDFPYISSYLAFRELPLLLHLLEHVAQRRQLADVLLVDGSGIAHPRRAGIATMLGIAAGIPTVGITKKSLVGRVDLSGIRYGEFRPLTDGPSLLGYATLPWSRSRKPIYVSPGHLTSVDGALAMAKRSLGRRRLPTPIYWADRISREHARAIQPDQLISAIAID